ncbi:MAG: hypothetical protein KF817_05495 [Phycisphaeraceae bacterium]|nr:hypothetical protein [Phycisphaeraceae bacterium]
MSAHPEPPRPYRPDAALAAWLWPGLGHIVLGDRRRGAYIMLGLLFLVFVGLLIGGVDAVDSRSDRLWFLAQVIIGPLAFVIDWLRSGLLVDGPPGWFGDPAWKSAYLAGADAPMNWIRRTGISHVNEIGTLFIALAGLMNLAVMLDALHPPRREPADRRNAADAARPDDGDTARRGERA